jgi:hypothetical protein
VLDRAVVELEVVVMSKSKKRRKQPPPKWFEESRQEAIDAAVEEFGEEAATDGCEVLDFVMDQLTDGRKNAWQASYEAVAAAHFMFDRFMAIQMERDPRLKAEFEKAQRREVQ